MPTKQPAESGVKNDILNHVQNNTSNNTQNDIPNNAKKDTLDITQIYIQFENMFDEDYKDYRKKFQSDAMMLEEMQRIADNRMKLLNQIDHIKNAEENFLVESITRQACVTFSAALKKSTGEITAKRYYVLLKKSCIETFDKYNTEYIRKTYFKPEAKNKICRDDLLTSCIDLLDSGDKILRGSSDAYKEIQRDLANLLTFNRKFNEDRAGGKLTAADTVRKYHYTQVMLRAIAEKAQRYINDRLGVELSYSATSYKGKRVSLMHKVCSILNANADSMDFHSLDNASDIISDIEKDGAAHNPYAIESASKLDFVDRAIYTEEYKAMIRDAFNSGPFNSCLYTETLLCDYVADVKQTEAEEYQELQDDLNHNLEDMKKAYLKEHQASQDDLKRDLENMKNAYVKKKIEALKNNRDFYVLSAERKRELYQTNPSIPILSEGLNGQHVTLEKADAYYEKCSDEIERIYRISERGIPGEIHQLHKYSNQLQKNAAQNPLRKDPLAFLDNMVYVDNTYKPPTDNYRFNDAYETGIARYCDSVVNEFLEKRKIDLDALKMSTFEEREPTQAEKAAVTNELTKGWL